MTDDMDRYASGDPPVPTLFAPAPAVPVIPAIPLHLAAAAAAAVAGPIAPPFCPVCVVFRFVANNAWKLAGLGLGVTSVVIASLAVGPYVSRLAKLVVSPVFIRGHPHSDAEASTSATWQLLPVIRIRTTASPAASNSAL